MSILKDSGKYLIGEIISKALPLIILPYMAYKMLGEEVANFAIYQSILAFLSAILVFSMDGAIARYYYVYGRRGINTLRITALKLIFAVSFCVLPLSFLSNNNAWSILVLTSTAYAVYLINLSVAQCSKQVNVYIKAQLVTSIVLISVIIILFEFNEANANNRLWSSCIAWIIAAVFLYKFTTVDKRISKNIQVLKKYISYFFGFGLPLVFHNLSGLLKGHVDRFFIFSKFQPEELAKYFFALQISSVFYLIFLSINRGFVPHLYEKLKEKQWTVSNVNRLAVISLFFIPILPTVLWFIPKSLYIFFFGVDYAVLKLWVPLMVLGYCILIPYFILVNYLFYKAQNKFISIVSIGTSFLHVLIVFYLSKKSMNWVVMSMAISSSIQVFFLYAIFYWKYLRI